MKRDPYPNDRYEVRRQDLILFVEEPLSGEGAKDTAVTRLKEDLLDPSFRIGKEIDVEKFLKEFDKVKKDSKKAERKYKGKRKEEVVSKGYRRFERGEPARLLALEVAMRHLEDCLDEERVLIGKDEFEEKIRDEVAQAFKEEMYSEVFNSMEHLKIYWHTNGVCLSNGHFDYQRIEEVKDGKIINVEIKYDAESGELL